MKSHRFMLCVVLMSLCTVAFAQSDAQKSSVAPVPSEAQKSFATMKSLAGEWEGSVNVPEVPQWSGNKLHGSLRFTDRAVGNMASEWAIKTLVKNTFTSYVALVFD